MSCCAGGGTGDRYRVLGGSLKIALAGQAHHLPHLRPAYSLDGRPATGRDCHVSTWPCLISSFHALKFARQAWDTWKWLHAKYRVICACRYAVGENGSKGRHAAVSPKPKRKRGKDWRLGASNWGRAARQAETQTLQRETASWSELRCYPASAHTTLWWMVCLSTRSWRQQCVSQPTS
jgi:hypothetical protein